MASVRSRNQRSRQDEDHDFRNWRSPHQKSSAADHFRHGGAGSRRVPKSDHSTRENDRHDRSGSHRTRYRHDKESKPHRWSSDRRDGKADLRSRKPDVYSSIEFPPLGAKEMNTSYTPDPVRDCGQLYSRTSKSRDWADQIDQFEKDKDRALRDMMRYKRRLLMSESSDGSNEDQENQRINMSATPKKEYETDETVIVRRQKQIELGKNTLGYDHYLRQIPKFKRSKNVHIATPNKFLKCSRRAWDGLIRQWRKKLHDYDPEGTYKPQRVARKELHFSDTTSEATSECSSEQEAGMDTEFNSSTSSAISDYLASNESSRPQTPVYGPRPETPTAGLRGLTVGDGLNGNYLAEVSASHGEDPGSTPDATLTPSVTPADREVGDCRPQVDPSDLIAALRHAAQSGQAPSRAAFHRNVYCVPPQLTATLAPRFAADVSVHSFRHSRDDDVKNEDIFDNFNLDDCFVNADEVLG